ncbi:MAG: hypothetical protein WKF47_04435 [Geodermatophilaceae bacterium]
MAKRVLVDRPALAGAAYAGDDLRPGEGLGDSAALDHREGGFLDGGEPPRAVRAGPAAADDLPLVDLTGVQRPGSRDGGSTDTASSTPS